MLQTHEAGMNAASPLRRGLSQRQLNMIALGGVIGAGLFVGSASSSARRAPARSSPTRCAACSSFW